MLLNFFVNVPTFSVLGEKSEKVGWFDTDSLHNSYMILKNNFKTTYFIHERNLKMLFLKPHLLINNIANDNLIVHYSLINQ
jgi:hypothetical protein